MRRTLVVAGVRLYPGHVPTTATQKALLGAASAVLAFVDPARTEQVARLGDVTSVHALRRLRTRMRASESGRLVLAERPSLKRGASFPVLAALETGTFGRAVADFMGAQHLSLDSRSDVQFGWFSPRCACAID